MTAIKSLDQIKQNTHYLAYHTENKVTYKHLNIFTLKGIDEIIEFPNNWQNITSKWASICVNGDDDNAIHIKILWDERNMGTDITEYLTLGYIWELSTVEVMLILSEGVL